MANKNNFIQGFVILDHKNHTEEEEKQLNQISKQYFLVFDEIKTLGVLKKRTLFYIVMRDEKLMQDRTDEEDNIIPGVLTLFSNRNPEILGIWKLNGVPLGQTKQVIPAVYNEETGKLITEEIINITGLALYPFKKDKYMPYMDDIVTYDIHGKELSRVRPTIAKPLRVFGGFEEPILE